MLRRGRSIVAVEMLLVAIVADVLAAPGALVALRSLARPRAGSRRRSRHARSFKLRIAGCPILEVSSLAESEWLDSGGLGCEGGSMNLAAIPEPRKRRRKGQAAPAAVGRAAIYVRVSVDERAEGNGGSLTSQEAAARAECSKRGLEVSQVYSDSGHSGGTLERPALAELRAAVKAGEVAAVVVYAVDRLSRRQADVLALLEEFAAAGAGIASASQPFDTTTPMGRAMIGVLAIFAELQREEIRARTRVALKRKMDAGEAVGRTPFGLRRSGKRYVADPDTWPTVARILDERSAGASCQAIADHLNAERVPTPTAHRLAAGSALAKGGLIQVAGKWSAATVARLCRSPHVRRAAESS
jgi:DNA invertase Pin-like site-specific DNA recombinase